MADRIVARATLDNGTTFSVELANITSHSVFIMTERRLAFRENVRLSIEGLELKGEVVYLASEQPRGAVLVLEDGTKLARYIERAEVLHATPPDELWSDSTEPAPEISLDEATSEDARIDPKLMRAAF